MKPHRTLVIAILFSSVSLSGWSQQSATRPANSDAVQASQAANPQAPVAAMPQSAAPQPVNAPAANADNAAALPQTKILSSEDASAAYDDPLKPPPLPKGAVSLIGGAVHKIDPIRERLTVSPFGHGKNITVGFDDRTHIFRDGRETTYANIHKGDRVYVDTMLVGPKVFARNIRVITEVNAADAAGQVTAYDSRNGFMRVQDQLSGAPVSFTVGPQTQVTLRDGRAGKASDLTARSLVRVQFFPNNGKSGLAKQVEVLALPGETFAFAGKITNVDMRSRTFAVENQTDGKIYDLMFDPASGNRKDLRIGNSVSVVAVFTGSGYRSQTITPQ